MTDAVVVDASVALKWILNEEYTAEALMLRDQWVPFGRFIGDYQIYHPGRGILP